ncbi:AVN_HP_G0119700.mRNA.1.CDS.1 [Saccharomyces cerevisiae]|nr:AVN_HP_G0119700.mRNA.1.CDS.1 [Saccharomyces cerevisiae]CAI6996826.1 AVN_HP_G0119700.mRNA.1.CDS.1 [Saccharomyces cerevisiae]
MEHWKSKLSKQKTQWQQGKRAKKRASRKNKKGKNQFEKAPVPLTLEEQIDNVSLRYGNELEGRSKDLINRFDVEDEKDIYERNYCKRNALKLLIELDSIDLINGMSP